MADLGRPGPELEPSAHGPGPAAVLGDPGDAPNNEQSSSVPPAPPWTLTAECPSVSGGEQPRHTSREVVTGLPRVQTFKRRLSEQRVHLEPVEPSAEERRTTSTERRCYSQPHQTQTAQQLLDLENMLHLNVVPPDSDANDSSRPVSIYSDMGSLSNRMLTEMSLGPKSVSEASFGGDAPSVTASQHDGIIAYELKSRWILNISMHFRDRSKREKFFVTYREKSHLWRRVTISLDYRDAPPNSLEMELVSMTSQKEKSAKIYEAIRDSLPDIQFYNTVTNLKLQTTDGRLHVHVVEDGNVSITSRSNDWHTDRNRKQ